MSVPSFEEILAKVTANAALGGGHTVAGGRYGGLVESVDTDDYDVEPEEVGQGSFLVKVRGSCILRHSDSDHVEETTECDIKIEATVSITPTSYDAGKSCMCVKIDVHLSDVVIECSNDDEVQVRD